MATENTQNNASQTLFRFVSLRNPQLTETKDKNLGFIHRQKEIEGFFDEKLLNQINESAIVKFKALEKYIIDFSNVFTNEKELETIFPKLLKAGRKISKREALNDDDITEISSKYDTLYKSNTDSYALLNKLWDNLIYQTVTQKDFYIKEAIIHILKALHYGYAKTLSANEEIVRINGADLLKKSLDGRVVLPMSLFGDGNSESPSVISKNNPFQVNVSKIDNGVIDGNQLPPAIQQQLKIDGERISELSFLELEKNKLVQLKSELETIQKTFYKLKNKEYETAYNNYRKRYQAAIDEYETALERVEAQINEEMSQQEIDALYTKLGESPVPPFVFEYKNELNFEDLKSKLSQDLFVLFIEHFTLINDDRPERTDLDFSQVIVVSDKKILIGEVSVLITDEYDTFAEVYEKLEEEIASQSQVLFKKSPAEGKEFAKIGNVLVPVNKTTYTEISGTYFLKVINMRVILLTNNILTFFYNTDNSSLGLLSASLEMTGDGSGIYKNIPSTDVVNGKVVFPIVTGHLKSVSKVKITLYFKNGEYTTIEHDNIVSQQNYTGKFAFRTKIEEEGSGNPDEGTETPGGGEPNTGEGSNPATVTFSRKNFGIKRLGVADYLKVVQSTHAYVPGEVTHIENVMAKEFKQKSTRKLRRSEIQTTSSKSTERENLSDTTSTTRNDMQSEVANVIQQDIQTQSNFNYSSGLTKAYQYNIGGSFATNNAKENSTRQAIAKSQEITEKATERILTKVAEERIEKIIEEFEENNAHGYDNRNGDKHVVGVYRWVDKKMKNQIYNYGIRTMFEFMIPEPAKLHRLATFATRETIKEPVDPRKALSPNTMPDAKSATDTLLRYWADYYGVTLTALPETSKVIVENKTEGGIGNGTRTASFGIPQNYSCEKIEGPVHCESGKKLLKNTKIWIYHPVNGGEIHYSKNKDSNLNPVTGLNILNTLNLNIKGNDLAGVTIQLRMYLKLSNDFINTWKQENFDAIIKAYETAYEDFLAKQKEADEKAKEEEATNKEKMSNFYRDMERVIIKHNCIAYLLQDYLNNETLGQTLTNKKQTMKEFSVLLGEDLDQYTALAKFLEQAFEWTIMDYTFYPYYWADRDEWQTMYLSESTDPLFRSFLQSGMARVIVTVNPGFEDAVQFFMATGKVWNGGEVPVIGDPMYLSIVDEMRKPVGMKQGKAWITTLPTSLNILQQDSVGLKTLTALPFTQENPEEFEVPADVVTDNLHFQPNNNLLGVKSEDTTEKIITGDWL